VEEHRPVVAAGCNNSWDERKEKREEIKEERGEREEKEGRVFIGFGIVGGFSTSEVITEESYFLCSLSSFFLSFFFISLF